MEKECTYSRLVQRTHAFAFGGSPVNPVVNLCAQVRHTAVVSPTP